MSIVLGLLDTPSCIMFPKLVNLGHTSAQYFSNSNFYISLVPKAAPATSWVHYTTSFNTHSLVLLKIGGTNARSTLS